MKKFCVYFALLFIGTTLMLWIIDKAMRFLYLMMLEPLTALFYLAIGIVVVYGLTQVKEVL